MSADTPDAPWGSVETRFEPIHVAARARDAAAVQGELDAGVDVDVLNGRAKNGDGGNTALWFAAQGPTPGGVEVARVLCDAGADVNRPCEHDWTPLHMAASWGHLDVARLLIERGADASPRDVNGASPADLAKRSKHSTATAVVEFLNALAHGGQRGSHHP